ncbi:MAG: TMEM165/GDT1 family protein [Actinomycetia bacterium]|nr:TMEM165/GDT1 family protein [Actinomycetes bacterium]
MDWKLLLSTFGILFLAELGDKTQLAVFSLSAKNNSPWTVWLGASLALVLVTLIGAFLGGTISNYVPARIVQLVAGTIFVVIGSSMLWQNLT